MIPHSNCLGEKVLMRIHIVCSDVGSHYVFWSGNLKIIPKLLPILRSVGMLVTGRKLCHLYIYEIQLIYISSLV